MSVFLTVLSVIGWVVLGLLCLVILLLVIPVALFVEWDVTGVKAKLKILFLSFTVYTQKEKPANEQKQSADEVENKEPTPKNEKKKMHVTFDKIVSIASAATGALKLALKGIWIKNIVIIYPVHKEDAAQTAIAFGKTQAYLAGGVATLENIIHLYFKQVNIIADFNKEYENKQYFSCKIVASPIIILIAGLYLLKQLIDDKIL